MKKLLVLSAAAMTCLAGIPAANAQLVIQPTIIESAPVYAPPPAVIVGGPVYYPEHHDHHHRYDWRYWDQRDHGRR